MLCEEIFAVCFNSHKNINALCGQDGEFLQFEPGGICSNHWALWS